MALLDWVGCALRDTGEFSAVSAGLGGGAVSFETDQSPPAGTASLRLDSGNTVGSDTTADLSLGADRNAFTARFWFLWKAGHDEEIARLVAGAGGNDARIFLTNIRQLLVRGLAGNVIGFVQFTGSQLADGDWILIEVSFDDSGGANKFRIRGAPLRAGSITLLTTEETDADVVGPWATLRLIVPGGVAGITHRYSQVLLDDAYGADLGPARWVHTLRPNGTSQSQWDTVVPSGATHHTVLDEVPLDHADYIETPTNADEDRFDLEDTNVPAAGGPANQVLGMAIGAAAKNTGTLATGDMDARVLDSGGAVVITGNFAPSALADEVKRAIARTTVSRSASAVNGYRASLIANIGAQEKIKCSAVWVTLVVDAESKNTESGSGVDSGKDLVREGQQDTGSGLESAKDLRRDSNPDSAAGADVATSIARAGDKDAGGGGEAADLQAALTGADAGVGAEAVSVETQIAHSDSAAGAEAAGLEVANTPVDTAAGLEAVTGLGRAGDKDSAVGAETANPAREEHDSSAGAETANLKVDVFAGLDEATGREEAVAIERAGDKDLAQGAEQSSGPGFESRDRAQGVEAVMIVEKEIPIGTGTGADVVSTEVEPGSAQGEAEQSGAASEVDPGSATFDVEQSTGGSEVELS